MGDFGEQKKRGTESMKQLLRKLICLNLALVLLLTLLPLS